MTGLQDPNRMSVSRLGADQIGHRVNDISKAALRDDWQFGKPPYSHSNPVPMVSLWSSYFAIVHLLIPPNPTWEVLLNAIQHPYARAPSQVVRVASEEPVAHGGGEEEAADVGAGRHAGKSCFFNIP